MPKEKIKLSLKLSPKKTGRLYMDLQDALSENIKLKKALKVFADYFEGDLKDVDGDTPNLPIMTMQPFKDAKKLLAE